MKKLLLVSGNLSLRMAVGGDYEIVEQRPSRSWSFDPASVTGVDVVLLDLHDPPTTSRVLDQIAAAGFDGPVLVCAVAGEDWTAVSDRSANRIGLVNLPVNGHDLTAALAELVGSQRSGLFGHRRADPPPSAPAQTRRPEAPGDNAVAPAPGADVTAAAAPPPPVTLPAQRNGNVYAVVRELTDALPRLRGLSSVSEDFLTAAVDATSSEAGVVLVPDGDYWRVSAGVGARHVEWRLAVPADAWLVDETINERHGVVVEGTDIARQRLSGVPLASWEHLMFAAAPDTDVVVLVARRDGAFSDDDIRELNRVGAGFSRDLTDALALRELSRALQQFADTDLQDETP
jgi:hypothetical protein